MDGTFNHKDARVLKLHAKGLPPSRIARKLGAPDDIARVLAALTRAGLEPHPEAAA